MRVGCSAIRGTANRKPVREAGSNRRSLRVGRDDSIDCHTERSIRKNAKSSVSRIIESRVRFLGKRGTANKGKPVKESRIIGDSSASGAMRLRLYADLRYEMTE